jgi:CubicO group peptidase (beta-lactamase class C family)
MSGKILIQGALALAAVLLLSPLTAAVAQSSMSAAAKTPAAEEHLRVFRKHLEALNAGDAEGLKKFAAEHLSDEERRGTPPDRVAQFELDFRQRVGGGLDLYKVVKNTDTELSALLKSRGEFPVFVRADWKFDAANPALVRARGFGPTATPEDALPPKVPAEQLAKEVDAKLTKMAADDAFSGAVLIAKDGKPIFRKAYGYADREAKTPNSLDTKFRLGSMNKMFTSVAVAQLVQAGRLKYTDAVAQLLPDYPDKGIAQKITVHHLLTHTSGLGDIFGPAFNEKKDSLREIKDYVQLFAGKPLRFEPGAGWSYSNAGFIVLGLIVEKASGQGYYDYVQKNIYDVAGMKNSGSYPKTDKIQNLAVGYMRQGPGGPWVPNWDTLPWRGTSAGGGDSTLEDLLRFDRALRGHKLLNKELTETVMAGKAQPGQNANSKYAYGFQEELVAGHRVVGHGGGAPGMNALLDMYLDNGYTVVVLSNFGPPAAQRVGGYIRERLQ